MSVAAGKLDKRLTIMNPVDTRNENTGEVVTTYSAGDTVWAAIGPVAGKWVGIASTMQMQVDTHIQVRYGAAVTVRHRLAWNGHTYSVQSIIDPDNRHEQLEILATELVG